MKKKTKGKQREAPRRTKKKISLLVQEDIDYIDWKDVNLLRRFMSDRAKIRARRVTGNRSRSRWRSRTPARWRCCPTPVA